MASASNTWNKGRGKLGIFAPLMGSWAAESDSPRGPVRCTRTFRSVLNGSYVQLLARWEMADGVYEEIAFFGAHPDGTVAFWSFTSDGKHSNGTLAGAADLHPLALAFEADMPAGRARMAYWPDEDEGFHWVVESQTKKGWNRFVHHHYRASEPGKDAPTDG